MKMKPFGKRLMALGAIAFVGVATGAASPNLSAQGATYGKRLFERLAGVPLLKDDPRFREYSALLEKGDLKGAAHLATEDDGFFSITVRNMAATMENGDLTPRIDFDDFQAAVIGTALDGLDARTLLTGDFLYRARAEFSFLEAPTWENNNHYLQMDLLGLSMSSTLTRSEPQLPNGNEAAGLLTTRGWAARQYSAGTNRRAVATSCAACWCLPIQTWKNVSLSDYHVRRDVSRVPGGDPVTYQSTCRACHAPMDALGGAFVLFDFKEEAFFSYPRGTVVDKFNQNAGIFPSGWTTTDDSWVNLLQDNPEFGWRSASTGRGVKEFGELLANSAQFSRCMVKRSFKTVCRTEMTSADQSLVQKLADRFEQNGYKLRELFEDVAIVPECLGTP